MSGSVLQRLIARYQQTKVILRQMKRLIDDFGKAADDMAIDRNWQSIRDAIA